jgi:hypothetical protein
VLQTHKSTRNNLLNGLVCKSVYVCHRAIASIV